MQIVWHSRTMLSLSPAALNVTFQILSVIVTLCIISKCKMRMSYGHIRALNVRRDGFIFSTQVYTWRIANIRSAFISHSSKHQQWRRGSRMRSYRSWPRAIRSPTSFPTDICKLKTTRIWQNIKLRDENRFRAISEESTSERRRAACPRHTIHHRLTSLIALPRTDTVHNARYNMFSRARVQSFY